MRRTKKRRTQEEVLRDDVTHVTGFSMSLVETYALLVEKSNLDVMAALIMVHCNSCDEEVRMLMHRFTGDARSTREIMKGAYAVLEATMGIDLSNPMSRFDRVDLNFPDTTALVDGVPCFMRGSKEYFNGKHKDMMMSRYPADRQSSRWDKSRWDKSSLGADQEEAHEMVEHETGLDGKVYRSQPGVVHRENSMEAFNFPAPSVCHGSSH